MLHRICAVSIVALAFACDTEPESPQPRLAEVAEAPARAEPDEDFAARIRALRPTPTRAGWLRFAGPEIEDPRAAPLLAERARDPGTPVAERIAAVEALPRTGATFAATAIELFASEREPRVRHVVISVLGRASAEEAMPGLELGLADRDARVRGEAARVAGTLGVAGLAPSLIAALRDGDAGVRSAAARSLGLLGADVFEEVVVLLDDPDAEVRLQTIHALERIDSARAVVSVAALGSDSDPRVARAAMGVGRGR